MKIECIDGIYYELRPLPALAPNEWRDEKGEVFRFEWRRPEGHPAAYAGGKADSAFWQFGQKQDGGSALRKALMAWASKLENLPHDVAIKDGVPYLMKDDEARDKAGDVRHCDWWRLNNLDTYSFAPGQRERVEKWRASQVPKLADDEVDYFGARKGLVSVYRVEDGAVVRTHDWSWFDLRDNISVLSGQSLTNARNYAKKHLKLAPNEYLCEESWTVKKRERRGGTFICADCQGTRYRVTQTEIFPGEE